jgi:hypothetical protein
MRAVLLASHISLDLTFRKPDNGDGMAQKWADKPQEEKGEEAYLMSINYIFLFVSSLIITCCRTSYDFEGIEPVNI